MENEALYYLQWKRVDKKVRECQKQIHREKEDIIWKGRARETQSKHSETFSTKAELRYKNFTINTIKRAAKFNI